MKNIPLVLGSFLILASCSDSPNDPVLPAYPNCTLDGQVGCIARTDFPSADKAAATAAAASFKTGLTFAGVAGTMSDCTGDNGIGCIASQNFPSVVKANLTAATVLNGSILAGVTGTFAPPCSSDGAIDCLTTTMFKAVNLAGLETWDIRKGKTIAGVAGTSVHYTNGATLTTFNRSAGTGSSADANQADFFDSIDDNAANLAIPVNIPIGAPEFASNWVRDSETDANANQLCDPMETCVYKDLLTGLSWLADNNMTYLWEAAISYCEGLMIGTREDWRVPTQKEMMQAYVNRIWGVKTPLALNAAAYYSATTVSSNQLNAFTVTFGNGVVSGLQIKGSNANRVLCVR